MGDNILIARFPSQMEPHVACMGKWPQDARFTISSLFICNYVSVSCAVNKTCNLPPSAWPWWVGLQKLVPYYCCTRKRSWDPFYLVKSDTFLSRKGAKRVHVKDVKLKANRVSKSSPIFSRLDGAILILRPPLSWQVKRRKRIHTIGAQVIGFWDFQWMRKVQDSWLQWCPVPCNFSI